ncbi:hypothetical protein RN001_014170 [Aquatica leii]|uniref:Odorant receptor n=1 Tax=Aquatica leii TaxID=1421715 RepID=A0AAN7NX52_9COLE|nr:hypothetical protein RN001_014170 [Aquatica leii]
MKLLVVVLVLCVINITGTFAQGLNEKCYSAKHNVQIPDTVCVDTKVRKCRNKMTVFFVSVLFTCLTQLIYSIILRYTNEDPKNWRLPFGMISIVNTTYSPGFEIAYVYQFTSIIYFITTCLTSTIIITGLLNFAATQFKIMQLKIKRILTNANNSSIQWRFLKTQIEELIRYHEFITEIVQEVSFMYGNMILCNFMGTLCINCVEIYRMSILSLKDSRVVNILAEIITGSFHTMLICKAGQNMTNESEKIAECIYEIDFVGTDLRFQKSIVILLRRAQKPARIKAGGLVNVSTVTSLHVLRLAYSAFTILRNVYNK